MRPDIAAPATLGYRRRTLTVQVYPITETPAELALGTASGSTTYSSYVGELTQTEQGMTVGLDLPSTVTAPTVGQCIRVIDTQTGGVNVTVFNGVIESVSTQEERGTGDPLQLTVRRRDADPFWRGTRAFTPSYPVGAQLGVIARHICRDAGLAATEYDLPDFGVRVGAGAAQLAHLSRWDMLRQVLAPGLLEPFVDARGFFRAISRNVQREPDIEIDDAEIVSIGAVTTRPGLTGVRVAYVDPHWVKVVQEERLLKAETVEVGFFNPDETRDVWYSEDKRARAENVRFVVVHGAGNNGFINPINASESFQELSHYGGRIVVSVDGLPTAAEIGLHMAAAGLLSAIPFIGTGLAVGTVLSALSQVGRGTYEIHGQLYDYVQRVHQGLFYDDAAPAWHEQIEDLESSLIPNEATMIAVGTMELLYRARAQKGARLVIADDYRIEPGDLLGLEDGTRFYVQTLARDLGRGEVPAHLALGGFFT